LLKKRNKAIKTYKNCRYGNSANTYKDCDCYMTPVVPSGRTPHDKRNRNGLDYNQNAVMSPGGAQRQDGQTD